MITIPLNFVLLMTEPFNFLARLTGKYDAGNSYKFPHLQLSGEHKYPRCHGIIHVIFGVFSLTHEKYTCQVCYKDNKPTHTPVLQEKT